jgi:pimeloyl-ACP methyl ester carboxylesterase
VSTPTSLELPDGVRRVTVDTERGGFAALEALPASGSCEWETALLVPGYTGSKEDFIAILDQLADRGRRVVAIDIRGQFETPGADDPHGYSAQALGADILAVLAATRAGHLLGHSYGGLIAREALLTSTASACIGPGGIESFTLMSSGPGALDGPRAAELCDMLTALGVQDGRTPVAAELRAGVAQLWRAYLEPRAVAAGVPNPIVAFLGRRMLSNDPAGLVLMARHMLTAPDRTGELAGLAGLAGLPMLVLYGENDNSWSPAAQEDMARRLKATRVCIPEAAHSPAVEAPATTASALTRFWDAAEAAAALQSAGRRLSLDRLDAVPRPPGHGGRRALRAVPQVVTPAAGRARARREHLVVAIGGQAVTQPLIGRRALLRDVLGPAQVPGE